MDLNAPKVTLVALLALLGLLSAAKAATSRVEISLNGAWQFQKVKDLAFPPSGEWKEARVPGTLSGWNYDRAWLRTSFAAPAAFAGKRVKLRFGGVKYDSVVYVNGQKVGGCFGGYEPFEVNITAAVKIGGPNELLVGVHDWTGLFSKQVDLSQVTEWHEVRNTPKDALLSVIGGLFTLYGIWDDVTLVALPPVHVADVFVQTSVRKKTLTALVTLRNEDTVQRTVRLESRVEGALELPTRTVTLEPGASETVEVSAAWPSPKLWSHETPHLYELKSKISDLKSQMGDETSTRFGFREFWCEGANFFLNGTRIILRATSTWPTGQYPPSREHIANTYRAIKAANTIAHRLHTQPWQKLWYEVADEVGLLIVVEGAVWCDHNAYRWGDQAFLDNYATHLRRTVGNLKNHPSVVMWSLENEILHCAPGGKESPSKDPLAHLGKLMKGYDPTRPITYEADLDPRGVADVVGLHYPHPEYPRVNQYPNVCYWMDEEIPMKRPLVDGEREKWKWDRQKPLYIGEFLWVPSADPSWHTILFGDEAYTDYNLYKRRAKAVAWKMQIEAYRFHGVNGICPWTMFEGGRLDETNPMYQAQKQGYEPVAAFLREYDRNFYAGQKVGRTFVVHNDVMSPSALTLRWSATCDGQSVAKGDAPAQLGPAERTTVSVEFTSPSVSKRTALNFEWTLERGGQRAFAESRTYGIHPAATLVARPGLGLYDTDGRTAKLFEAQGMKFTRLASLSEIPSSVRLLVIGDNSFRPAAEQKPVIGQPDPDASGLDLFVRKGGRLLVLAQENYFRNLLPTTLSKHASTIAFAQMPGHPVLQGIEPDDLRFWRGDHLVSRNECVRADRGGGAAIIVSGSQQGLTHAPLMEFRRGAGVILLAQLRLVEKFSQDPIAGQLLGNLLAYAATLESEPRRTVLVSDDNAFRGQLESLQVRYEDATGKLAATELPRSGLLIHHGSVDEMLKSWPKVEAFAAGGGNVLLHGLREDGYEKLRPLLKVNLQAQTHKGPVVKNADEPLMAHIAHEDLYWLGKHVGHGWATTPMAEDVASLVFTKALDERAAKTYEAEQMEVTGQITKKEADYVILATVGEVSCELDFPATGNYLFGIRAGGTPLDSVFPIAALRVDGKLVGSVSLSQKEWKTYALSAKVAQGKHRVSVAFTNDASRPPEDRNLYLDKLLVSPEGDVSKDVTLLTSPGAVVRVARGQGAFVIDQIKWDTERRNVTKANRYACGLLTALGADFGPRPATLIEAETMTENEGIRHFRRLSDHVVMPAAGNIRTTVECAADDDYVFEIVGKGTPAEGVYPVVRLDIDGKEVGQVEIASDAWRSFRIEARLTQGAHELVLSFINDKQTATEDRNVWLDRIAVFRKSE